MKPHRRAWLFVYGFSTLLTGLSSPVAAGDWPGWRGPGGVGVSDETGIPVRLGKNLLWTWSDPGRGHSSPIVWKGTIFLTTAVVHGRLLVSLDARTGAERWRVRVLEAPAERMHRKNSAASATPATDGERVYVSFLGRDHRVVVVAYDLEGSEVWRVSPGEHHSIHGFCSTPILFRDLVLLNCDQDAYAYLVAFDRKTGEIRWKTHRENEVRSYCPPTVFEIEGRPQMMLSGSETVASYDPLTGKRIWVCDGPTEQCVASLVLGRGLVFVTGGFPDREFLAIDPTGRGDVTDTHIRWRQRRGVAYVPSPLYREGHFYVVSDDGILSVLEAETGRYVKQRRLPGDFSASLLSCGGHIYAASEDGEVFVLRESPDLELVSQWEADAPIYASPVPADGRLYIRSWKTLHAFGSQPSGSSAVGSGPARG